MANYKEIVTKAVIGKGKRTFTDNNTVKPANRPNTILGCWVINSNFKGIKEDKAVRIEGSYDVNIWYSYENNTLTDVIRETINYQEVVNVKKMDSFSDEEIIIRSLNGPTVIQAAIEGDNIVYTVEKELGIELVGNTKVKIETSDVDDVWDLLDEEDSNVKEIDNEVTEEFLD